MVDHPAERSGNLQSQEAADPRVTVGPSVTLAGSNARALTSSKQANGAAP